MSRTIRASVLILLLACSAYAGEMQNGVTGDMQNGSTAQSTTVNTAQEPQASENTITQVVLTILTSVLG